MDRTQTFEQFLANTSAQVSLTAFAMNLAVAAILAIILGRVYITFGKSLSNRHIFARNFLILTMTIMVIITIVKSSLALSLGLVGALSIVRFRTAIKEPEELTYAFLAIAIGLGLGADQLILTCVAFTFIVAIIIIRDKVKKAPVTEFGNLRISGRTADIDIEKVTEILKNNSIGVALKRLDEAENNVEVIYSVAFESYEDLIKTRQEINATASGLSTSYFDNIGNI
jgi:hypothetical protein